MKTDNITSFVLGIVCFFSFLTPYAEIDTSEAPLNLLSNESFEEGAYSPTESPIDWAWDAWQPSAIFTWDDTQARTGDKSVKIYASTPNDAMWIQTVDVEPNTWYFLSGWIRTDNVGHTAESEPVDAGANLSLFGTWERSTGVFGSRDWTRNSILFNSGVGIQVTVGARLGYWAGTTTGTAWFDDLQLTPIVPMDPHPGWKILVLIYQETDFEITDENGIYHHYVASMTQDEMEQAGLASRDFVGIDIPALTSENMVPQITVRFPDRALTRLSPIAGGWWPSPEDTASERDPQFDSVIVIWDTRATDLATGVDEWIGYGDGLAANMGTGQTYNTMQIDAAISRAHRNVFKHEWGHSILFFYDAMGTAPKPAVSNHADATQYVNCQTGQFYVWQDETLANPIPDSIYNNESGFTHDYYSGNTATADQPTRCLGISPDAWAFGGPVSHSGNTPSSQNTIIVASVLPVSRSVQVGNTAAAFATIVNAGSTQAISCSIAPITSVAANFAYQTTDPSTNALVGSPNTPVDISVGASQSFVFSFTPSAPILSTAVELGFDCSNTDSATVISGVNTLLLSASSGPVADMVALAATPTGDGIVKLPGSFGANAFAVATVNVGSSGTITASADTGTAVLPVSILLCETNPSTGACLSAAASNVTTTIGSGSTPTFSIFATAADAIPFEPANNRIFVHFKDPSGVTRGSTSVAVQTL